MNTSKNINPYQSPENSITPNTPGDMFSKMLDDCYRGERQINTICTTNFEIFLQSGHPSVQKYISRFIEFIHQKIRNEKRRLAKEHAIFSRQRTVIQSIKHCLFELIGRIEGSSEWYSIDADAVTNILWYQDYDSIFNEFAKTIEVIPKTRLSARQLSESLEASNTCITTEDKTLYRFLGFFKYGRSLEFINYIKPGGKFHANTTSGILTDIKIIDESQILFICKDKDGNEATYHCRIEQIPANYR